MDQVTPYLGQAGEYLQSGYAGVNTLPGLLIALIVTMMMKEWKGLWVSALMATLFFYVVQTLAPALQGRPPLLPADLPTVGFWIGVLVTYVGYVIVLAILFLIKKMVLKAA